MHHHYDDIRERISEEPKWFDENAVPRYCEFSPNQVSCIYAREVVLAEVACQNCRKPFLVAFSVSTFDFVCGESLANAVGKRQLHYGDPPNVSCCASGPAMTSDVLRIVEFWKLGSDLEWRRVPELEIVFDNEDDGE